MLRDQADASVSHSGIAAVKKIPGAGSKRHAWLLINLDTAVKVWLEKYFGGRDGDG